MNTSLSQPAEVPQQQQQSIVHDGRGHISYTQNIGQANRCAPLWHEELTELASSTRQC